MWKEFFKKQVAINLYAWQIFDKFFGGFIDWPMLGHPSLLSALLDGLSALRSASYSVGIGLPSLFSSALSNSLAAIAFAAIDQSYVLRARTSSNMSDVYCGICSACLRRQREIWSFTGIFWMKVRLSVVPAVHSALPRGHHRPSQCGWSRCDRSVCVSSEHCAQLPLNRFLLNCPVSCQGPQQAAKFVVPWKSWTKCAKLSESYDAQSDFMSPAAVPHT